MIYGPALVPADQNLRGPRGSLALAEADELRKLARAGVHPAMLARRFGISIRTVYRYTQGAAYRCRECGRSFHRLSEVRDHVLEVAVVMDPRRPRPLDSTDEATLALAPSEALAKLGPSAPYEPVPDDFATHVAGELRRRNMRPGLLAYLSKVPDAVVLRILAGHLCPDRETWRAICAVIGTPAQVAARRNWKPVITPRELHPSARNAAYRTGDVRR